MKKLSTALLAALDKVRSFCARHPRTMTTSVAALALAGGGAYALAAAVVSLAPDATHLPVHEISVELPAASLPAQAAALDAFQYSLHRSGVSRSKDTAESLLRRLGVADATAVDFLRRDALAQRQLLGRAGRNVSVETDNHSALLKLTARWSPDDDGTFKRLVIERSGKTFVSRQELGQLTASTRIAGGVIEFSLFASTDAAGIPEAVGLQMAEIFSADIDFYRELRKGDRYTVVYEMLEGDGEPLRAGRVLSAEFTNAGKTHQAMWFQEPATPEAETLRAGRATSTQGRSGYYTLEGQSLKRAYLASPLAFSRVTSGFKMRFHPILQKWAAHLGVDYAAPVGTPVRSVGDGVVEFAGVQNGYGNAVFIRHRNNQVTVYAHLSRIFVHKGQRVEQGQNIAATGATGWATGPHLHYEFRVNGQHQNPLAIARRSESLPVAAAMRPAFERLAAIARQQLGAAQLLAQQ